MKNVLIAFQHHRSEMSTWLVWGGCDKPQCADVYSHFRISASYTIHWGTITQYLCVYACTYICVHKTCTNHGSHTMMSPTESRISGLMCHNLTSTIWMTVSSLLSWWFASICQTRAPKPWWWMRGRQSDRYDWLISHLQEGCSNVDVAGAVVVALTVGQCFSALILEALLPPAPTRLIQMISLPSDNEPFIWLRRQEGGKELDWKTLQQK